MKNRKIAWEEIKSNFNQEWVELVDYVWPDSDTYPTEGIVRSHGSDKKEFHLQCRKEPRPLDSAIIFVGPPISRDGSLFSPSLIRID